MEPKWLEWARKVQALAQNGLAYTESAYDRERYEELREVALEMLAAGSGADMADLRELFAGETGYATPKVDVRGVVSQGDRILLVKEHVDGKWTLPGGWADAWDAPSQAVEREVREESGYQVRADKLLACWDRRLHGHPPTTFRIFKLFFRCALLGGEPTKSMETDEIGFFGEGAVPELSLPRTTPWEMARLYEHMRRPELPAEFD